MPFLLGQLTRRWTAGRIDRHRKVLGLVDRGSILLLVYTAFSGLPMASVLFGPHLVGLVVLPLLLFHQIQLMACAALVRRWAARTESQPDSDSLGLADVAG